MIAIAFALAGPTAPKISWPVEPFTGFAEPGRWVGPPGKPMFFIPSWWPSERWRNPKNRPVLSDREFPPNPKPGRRGRLPRFRVSFWRGGGFYASDFKTLAEACGYFDEVLGFGAARIAFTLSYGP